MKKDYLIHALALRMKAIEFKERVLTYYEDGKKKLHNNIDGWDFNSSFLNCVSRPTHSQCLTWFRDKYKVDGWVVPVTTLEGEVRFYDIIIMGLDNDYDYPSVDCLTFEEAEHILVETLIEFAEKNKIKTIK